MAELDGLTFVDLLGVLVLDELHELFLVFELPVLDAEGAPLLRQICLEHFVIHRCVINLLIKVDLKLLKLIDCFIEEHLVGGPDITTQKEDLSIYFALGEHGPRSG